MIIPLTNKTIQFVSRSATWEFPTMSTHWSGSNKRANLEWCPCLRKNLFSRSSSRINCFISDDLAVSLISGCDFILNELSTHLWSCSLASFVYAFYFSSGTWSHRKKIEMQFYYDKDDLMDTLLRNICTFKECAGTERSSWINDRISMFGYVDEFMTHNLVVSLITCEASLYSAFGIPRKVIPWGGKEICWIHTKFYPTIQRIYTIYLNYSLWQLLEEVIIMLTLEMKKIRVQGS